MKSPTVSRLIPRATVTDRRFAIKETDRRESWLKRWIDHHRPARSFTNLTESLTDARFQ